MTIAAGSIGIALYKAARTGEMFNRAMRNSLAIMGDVSMAMRRDMVDAANKAASVTIYSAEQMGRAYFYLASAGLKTQQSLQALPVVARFAQAGMFNVARATELLTDAQSALGLKVKNATENERNMIRVSDALVTANTMADATVEQFALSLSSRAGASMRMYNISLADGLAMLAAFADQGIKAEEAGTQFHMAIRDLTRKAIENTDVFKKWGVQVYDTIGRLRRPVEIVEDLERATGHLSTRLRKQAFMEMGFQERSVIAIQKLMGFSTRMYEWAEVVNEGVGKTAEVASKQMTEWQKATAQLSAAWTEFGHSLTPVVDKLSDIVALMRFVVRSPGAIKSLFDKVGAGSIATPPGAQIWGQATDLYGWWQRRQARQRGAKQQQQFIANYGIGAYAKQARAQQQQMLAPFAGKPWLGYLSPAQQPRRAITPSGPSEFTQAARRTRDRYEMEFQRREKFLDQFATPQERYNKAIMELNLALNYGYRQPELYRRAMAQLQEELDRATGKTAKLAAAETKRNQLQQRGLDLMRSLETPQETYARRLKEYMGLYKAGALTFDQYKRAQAAANMRMQDAAGPTGPLMPRLPREIDLSRHAILGVQTGKKQQVTDPLQHKLLQQIRAAIVAQGAQTPAITP